MIDLAFLNDGGEMGARIRAHDWSETALGELASWPQSLRTATAIVLRAPFPVVLLWGAHGVALYNDAYLTFAGDDAAMLFGSSARTGRPDALAGKHDEIRRICSAGGTLKYQDLELTAFTRGSPERFWFDLDCAPVLDEDGKPAGAIIFVADTTERVSLERRQAFQLALEQRLREAPDPVSAIAAASGALSTHLGGLEVAYSEVEPGGEIAASSLRRSDVIGADRRGSRRLNDYGPGLIDDLRTGKTIVIPDVALDPRSAVSDVRAAFEQRSITAFLAVPVIVDGQLSAILSVHDRTTRYWLAEDIALAQDVAKRTSAAAQRAHDELARRASEARRDAALRIARLGTFEWEPSTGALTLDTRACEISGIRLGELVTARAALRRFHRDDRIGALAKLAAAAARREGVELDFRVMLPDGTNRWVSGFCSPLPVGDDGREIMAGVIADVTERKRAELDLLESESRFRLMADAVPAIVWVTDAEGRNEFFNKQWFDYTGAKLVSTTALQVATDHVHPEDSALTIAAFDEARRTGTPYLVEHRIRARDGGYRWFLVRAEPQRDSTGGVVRWFGASVDVHDRKKAEAELVAFNATLEQRVEERTAERDRVWRNSRDLLLVIDNRWTMTAVNPAVTPLLGYAVAEVVGRKFSEYVHPEDLRTVGRSIRAAAKAPVGDFEARLRTRSGDWLWFSWSAAPGEREAYVIGRDVSAEKARAAELEHAQEALRQSQKLEAMGALTGGVAHDFNNLLSPIVGSLDLLHRRGVGSERERRLIDGALQAAERARVLVQRLLAFARRQPLQPRPVDLGTLVVDMSNLVATTVGPQIKPMIDVAEDLPAALADANQVEMAILNLSVNARDAMPDGGTLRISVASEEIEAPHRSGLPQGRYVRLSVADTGIGMDDHTAARAIEPFFSTKGVGRGTGLGLSMVHGLALQLGGALAIDTAPRGGTTIEIWLPASEGAADGFGEVEIREVRPSAGIALLVDDEELVRASTGEMLRDLGYTVVEAASAEEALRLVEGGLAYSVLVTDHLMPGMTGVDLARELRSQRPEVGVLIVSGYSEVEGLAPELSRLAKPFRQADLAAKLGELDINGSLFSA